MELTTLGREITRRTGPIPWFELQCYAYIAQQASLIVMNEPLFEGGFEAEEIGPVCRELLIEGRYMQVQEEYFQGRETADWEDVLLDVLMIDLEELPGEQRRRLVEMDQAYLDAREEQLHAEIGREAMQKAGKACLPVDLILDLITALDGFLPEEKQRMTNQRQKDACEEE